MRDIFNPPETTLTPAEKAKILAAAIYTQMKGRKLARRQIPIVLQRIIHYISREIHKKVFYTRIKLLLIVLHVFMVEIKSNNLSQVQQKN